MTTELVVKKLLLATAVVAAAGGAGYLYQNNTTPSDSVSLLSQVPADSLIILRLWLRDCYFWYDRLHLTWL